MNQSSFSESASGPKKVSKEARAEPALSFLLQSPSSLRQFHNEFAL